MSSHSTASSPRLGSSEEEIDDLDFQDPLVIPSIVNRKRPYVPDETDDDQEVQQVTLDCVICLQPFTNDRHRPHNLKCGHVFGGSCIKRYIGEMLRAVSYATCPVCEETTLKSHPRKVWPTKVIPENEEDLQPLKRELEEAQEKLKQLRDERMALKDEIDVWKYKIDHIDELPLTQEEVPISENRNKNTQELKDHFLLVDKMSVINEHCTLIDVNSSINMIAFSCYNATSKAFGFRKCNLHDLSVTEFIKSDHQATIRAMKMSDHGMLLSTGDDKTLTLTSLTNNRVVQSYSISSPGYSCCFDERDSNSLLCGTENGELYIFDLRNTRDYMHKLKKPTKTAAPVRSIVPCLNDIVCMDSSNLYVWSQAEDGADGTFSYKSLNIDSTEIDLVTEYLSMRFSDGLFCTLTRSQLFTTASVWHLSDTADIVMDWSYDSQQQMDDIQQFTRDENGPYICFTLNNEIKVRSKTTELQTIQTANGIADWCCTKVQGNNLLAVLSPSDLQLFEFV